MGMTPAEFLEELKEGFVVEEKGPEIYKPEKLAYISACTWKETGIP